VGRRGRWQQGGEWQAIGAESGAAAVAPPERHAGRLSLKSSQPSSFVYLLQPAPHRHCKELAGLAARDY